jgi:hypothetical protein
MDPQDFGRLGYIPLSRGQDPLEQAQLHYVLPLRIKFTTAMLQALIDRLVQILKSRRRERRHVHTGRGFHTQIVGQEIWQDHGSGGHQQGMLDDALQLADVAWPGILLQQIHCRRRYVVDVLVHFARVTP